MKKITSIVLALFMLINGCVMAFATDTAKTEDKNLTDDKYLNESIEILQALGLQTDIDLTKVDLEARVTRAQWAESAVELLNVNLSDKADDTVYFYDVPKSHYAAHSINYLASLGVVNGYNKLFNPDDEITLNEATKIILSLVGYSDYCEASGGYPRGYYSVAKKVDLYEGISASQYLTEKEMIIMLRNALSLNLSQKIYANGENTTTISRKGNAEETLLYVYYKAYFGSGRVTSVGDVEIDSNKLAGLNNVIIDDETYEADKVDMYSVLGEQVDFMYREDEILWARSNGRTDVFTLEDTYETNLGFNESDFSITYTNESGRKKEINLSQNAAVIYNNEVYAGNLKDIINDSVSQIRFLKDGGGSGYDIVIIRAYRNVYVSGIESSDVVYGSNRETVKIDSSKYSLLRVFDVSGQSQSVSYITTQSLISVFESASGKYMDIYVNKKPVKGKIDLIESDKISIDGVTYKAKDENVLNGVRAGDNVEVYCDISGYIGHIKALESAENYAYLAKMNLDSYRLYLKMFTDGNEMKRYCVENSIRVDGKKAEPEEAYKLLKSRNAEGQAVIFGEKDGELSFIETASGSRRFYIKNPMSDVTYWTKGVYKMGTNVIFDTKTKIFVVPSVDSGDDGEYSIINASKLRSDTGIKNYNVEAYKSTEEFGPADVMIIKGAELNTPTNTQNHYIVESISQALNENDEIVYAIDGYKLDISERIVCSSEVNPVELGISYGDVIRPLFNNKNEVSSINTIWKNDGSKVILTNPSLDYEIRNLTGYITDISGEFIMLGHSLGGYDEAFSVNNVPILVCDSTARGKEIRVGDASELVSYEAAGSNASFVFLQVCNGVRYIVIYK